MKVLFVSSWFPNRVTPLNGDFVERHALAVSRVCSTAVLHVMPDTKIQGRIMEIFEIQKNGLFEVLIYIRRLNGRSKFLSGLVNRLLYGLGYFIGYIIVKKELGKPDIIHSNIIVPASRVALMLHRFTGIPYIISEHWTGYLTEEFKKISRSYYKPVSKAFALVPVTHSLKDALISFGYNVRFFVVPNVVDTAVFRPASASESAGPKRMVHVSSMKDEHKNISGIIRAIRMLHEKRNDFVFTFVGNASLQQKNLVDEAGLAGCVIFAGEVEHRNVARIMMQSDFLVMFSNVENLPCVMLEALACGLPLISTRVGGITEWFNEKHGILINRGDEKGLYDGMNYLLDHHNEYDRDELNAYAKRNFSPEVIASRFLDIYQMALNKRKE
jgi:glycosyltransferase involved in cell wall biosynthesis